jgi:hypothetical protein
LLGGGRGVEQLEHPDHLPDWRVLVTTLTVTLGVGLGWTITVDCGGAV